MMRYQSMSQQEDCLSFANGRRPKSLKVIKEDEQQTTTNTITNDNINTTTTNQSYSNGGKAPTFAGFDNRAHRIRPGPNPSTAQDRTFPAPPPPPATHQHDAAGDAPLQWGHKKRTRVPRTDLGRTAADDPPAVAAGRRPAKAPRLPPPPGGTHHRGVILRSSSSSNPNRTVDERSSGKRSPPLHAEKTQRAANRAGNGGADATNPPSSSEAVAVERAELPKIYLTLSRKEKEEDFLLMKGTKLPQRPKKRLKVVEKALQYIYPGMWLSDLSRGRYEVREKKCARKKRRGLKGMESIDSDSY